jgi:hypothetical protein
VKRKKSIKAPENYESIDSNEFERFDKLVTGVLKVPYSELRKRIEADERTTGKKKARKKRARKSTSPRAASRDSEADA